MKKLPDLSQLSHSLAHSKLLIGKKWTKDLLLRVAKRLPITEKKMYLRMYVCLYEYVSPEMMKIEMNLRSAS